MNLQFQHKELVFLLTVLVILVFIFIRYLRWKKKVKRRMGDERLVSLLIGNFSPHLFTLKFIILAIAFFAGVMAAMNLRKPGSADNNKRKGIDIVIALDVSKSMLATDLAPSRLERARQFVNKLIDEMPDDRIALVLFAGKAYLQMPLTIDHNAARMFVSAADPLSIPQQGTVISDALKMSAGIFTGQDKKFKSVILISDGEDHEDDAVNTAKELAEQGVMINTIGIGSPDGAEFTDPATGQVKKDEEGNVVVSKLNEAGLISIAKVTNGIYTRLQSSNEAVYIIKEQLKQIDRRAFSDISGISYKNYFTWFAAAMFLLLIIELILPEIRIGRKSVINIV